MPTFPSTSALQCNYRRRRELPIFEFLPHKNQGGPVLGRRVANAAAGEVFRQARRLVLELKNEDARRRYWRSGPSRHTPSHATRPRPGMHSQSDPRAETTDSPAHLSFAQGTWGVPCSQPAGNVIAPRFRGSTWMIRTGGTPPGKRVLKSRILHLRTIYGS